MQRAVSGDVFLLLSISPTPSQRKGRREKVRVGVLKERQTLWAVMSQETRRRDKAKLDLETRNWDQPQTH